MTKAQADSEGLVSLGSLFHEPVWLFYRQDSAQRLLKIPQLTRLNQMAGWKLNVGAPGSGVPPLMAQMLEANAVPAGAVQLSPLPLTPAVVELLEGRMDALVLASAPESPMVQMLLQTPGIALFDFVQAEAYARRFAFMSAVMLPRGVVNLSADQFWVAHASHHGVGSEKGHYLAGVAHMAGHAQRQGLQALQDQPGGCACSWHVRTVSN